LIQHLEMQFGNKHLEQVSSRSNETLQQYEAEITRLVCLAASQDIRERMSVRAFVRGVKDRDTEQALRLATCKTLHDALAYALEFER